MPVSARLRGRKPELVALEGDSLGAHLRRRRRELRLRRVDAAKLVGADEKTLMWWERDQREPIVSLYPGILAFLGYEPWPEPQSLRDALLAERRRRGINLAQAAELVGVDEGTWRRWETGEWKPMSRAAGVLSELLGYPIKRRFPAEAR